MNYKKIDVTCLVAYSSKLYSYTIHFLFRFPKLRQWIQKMNQKDVCKRINKPGSDEHVWGLKAIMENAKYNNNSLQSKL